MSIRLLTLASLLTAGSLLEAQVVPIPGGSRLKHPPATTLKVPKNPTVFGDPLPGLDPTQLTNFSQGQAQFDTAEDAADGLGPILNAQSCSKCHSQPVKLTGEAAIGGASAITETRFGASAVNNTFNPLGDEGNTLLHQMAITLDAQETIPQDATIVAHRKTTPLFGLGLVDAIPDAAIIANAKIPKGDGIKGHAAILTDAVTTAIGTNKVGRFGWKAQQATLLAFSGDAYLNEMGVANRIFPADLAPDGDQARLIRNEPPGLSATGTQDFPTDRTKPENPDTNKDDTDRFKDFMTTLAPPPVLPLTRQAMVGQQLFTVIKCASCHTPNYKTGPNSIASLAFKNVPLYSDLLLHNMGSLGDGIGQANAQPDEMRTSLLWGLRARAPYLHDGRAQTVTEAILMHTGEAQTVRDRFAALPDSEQKAIVAFLNSI